MASLLPITLLLFLASIFPLRSLAWARSSPDLPALLRLNALLRINASELAHDYPLWTGSNCCSWYGVDCDSSNSRVIGLYIDYINATREELLEPVCDLLMLQSFDLFVDEGPIRLPSCMGNLRFLSRIILEVRAPGSGPSSLDSICSLRNLTALSFLGDISGLPPSVCILERLTWLHLLNPPAKSLSCVQSVPKLSSVSLDYDLEFPNTTFQLNSILSFVTSVTSLQSLQIHLSVVLPATSVDLTALCKLTHLTSLDVSGFPRTSNAGDCLGKLQNLQVLRFSGNGLSGNILPSLSQLEELQILDLSYNSLTGDIPPFLLSLTNLQTLDLSSNLLTGDIPPFLSHLTNLRNLELGSNSLMGAIPSSLSHLTNLQTLDLSSNSLTGDIPPFLSHLTNLRDLDLSSNSLMGAIPSSLSHLTNLQYLGLSSNPLTGDIPPSLSQLEELQNLHLANISLSGNIPTFLSNLTNLQYLDLSSNSLTGTIPAFLSQLKALTSLSLSHNRLSGVIPPSLFHLPNRQLLDLSFNNLSGTLPANIPNMNMPRELDFSHNQLCGSIPSEYLRVDQFLALANNKLVTLDCSNLSSNSLEYVDLSGNKFTQDVLRCFSTTIVFPYLLVLNLSGNPLKTTLTSQISRLPMISYLGLSSCELYGSLPNTFFRNLTSLNALDLHANHFNGSIPSELGFLSYLHYLDLSNNNFTAVSAFPKGSNLSSLTHFFLSGNKLKGNLSTLLDMLHGTAPGRCSSSSTPLQFLDFSDNILTGVLPPCLGQCQNLRRILLGGNYLQGNIPPEFGNLKDLTTLSLPDNCLSGEIPPEIRHSTSLVELDLSNNQLSGSLENSALSHLSHLRILLLRSNQLNGFIPSWIGEFSEELQLIDLSNNNFSGEVPQTMRLQAFRGGATNPGTVIADVDQPFERINFGNVEILQHIFQLVVKGAELRYPYLTTALVGLDFSNNNLTGTIPSQLGFLSGMKFLNLSRNKLTGSIPSSLSNLSGLESLDLSYNQLQGHIPSDFSKLTELGDFNVSFNNLSGGIPQTPQFETSTSYLGNDHLCDQTILHRACSHPTLPPPPIVATPFSGKTKPPTMMERIDKRVSLDAIYLGTAVSFVATLSLLFLCKVRGRLRYMVLFWKQNKLPSSSSGATSGDSSAQKWGQPIQELELASFPRAYTSAESTDVILDTADSRHPNVHKGEDENVN